MARRTKEERAKELHVKAIEHGVKALRLRQQIAAEEDRFMADALAAERWLRRASGHYVTTANLDAGRAQLVSAVRDCSCRMKASLAAYDPQAQQAEPEPTMFDNAEAAP